MAAFGENTTLPFSTDSEIAEAQGTLLLPFGVCLAPGVLCWTYRSCVNERLRHRRHLLDMKRLGNEIEQPRARHQSLTATNTEQRVLAFYVDVCGTGSRLLLKGLVP